MPKIMLGEKNCTIWHEFPVFNGSLVQLSSGRSGYEVEMGKG